ncbi:NAD-dependent succinate-semialdehyde dehydrogenase [Luteimonas sp. 8-5]|uniref:NAD-dependent succinate-semialdehyde dehydrogenase n=1 Tax=Luteimonas sp. 8-5 TaxID=3039387 RepID=UPI002436C993|nr:NAD-dependent succinate-semialdehyde dehydrogenase [Luteimonas sp. 8-5]MDG6348882.1 NAD-dependent succinate-semialdehyde dehydrogenase [Luteimonas sp. 8-5]
MDATDFLDDPGLLRMQCPIGGAWRDADGDGTCEVTNPATGERLGTVPDMGAAETGAAIEAAAAAFPAWAARTAQERANVLRRMHALMMEHQEDLARLMTAEQGKPLAESRGEVAYSAAYLQWFAEEGRRMYGEVIPAHAADKRIVVLRQPVGVVGAITPWNFPSAMLGRKLGPALAAGCTVVCKPALQTPYSALALAVIGERAGLPPGTINIVTGSDAAAIGEAMTAHPKLRKLSFTGSTAVGKQLMRQCADGLKRVSLELGGNAPFIVFEDADLDAAVEGAIASKYRNTGQTCVCANRLFVHDAVYDAFTEKLVAAVSRLRVGDGLAGETDQGPLIDARALEKVEAHVADALAKGASVVLGGGRHALGGTYYQPTVLRDASLEMRLAQEETFGPVAPLFRFRDEAEALAMANATPAGLAGYFYTRDLARSWRVAEALECGIVGINTGLVSTEVAPFGGVKESGIGREGSRHGLHDYTELKYTCIGA